MKHTKNMIVKKSPESEELTLYAVNTAELYRARVVPIIDNLARKMARGTYDAEKAIDAFYYVAEGAAKMYRREFCSDGVNTVFDVTARYTCAAGMLEHYADAIQDRADELRAAKKGRR